MLNWLWNHVNDPNNGNNYYLTKIYIGDPTEKHTRVIVKTPAIRLVAFEYF